MLSPIEFEILLKLIADEETRICNELIQFKSSDIINKPEAKKQYSYWKNKRQNLATAKAWIIQQNTPTIWMQITSLFKRRNSVNMV